MNIWDLFLILFSRSCLIFANQEAPVCGQNLQGYRKFSEVQPLSLYNVKFCFMHIAEVFVAF